MSFFSRMSENEFKAAAWRTTTQPAPALLAVEPGSQGTPFVHVWSAKIDVRDVGVANDNGVRALAGCVSAYHDFVGVGRGFHRGLETDEHVGGAGDRPVASSRTLPACARWIGAHRRKRRRMLPIL